MKAATRPRANLRAERLLVVDGRSGPELDTRIAALPSLVRPGDLLVLNDAATLPASLEGEVHGQRVELRLAGELGENRFRAVLFGEGSWRDDTDHRPPPPRLAPGDRISLGPPLEAEVLSVDDISPRLVELRFHPGGSAFWSSLYRLGQPIQYRYLERELQLAEVQTPYASRPVASEMPSAGRPLSPDLLSELRRAGVRLAWLTHAAGLSATGDPLLDARLPLPERYHLPAATLEAIAASRALGGRIIAVGTTVARALEGAARQPGGLTSGPGETDLVLGPSSELRVVDALLSGVHDRGSSHHRLLEAFARPSALDAAERLSEARGYLGHELGDHWLIWRARAG